MAFFQDARPAREPFLNAPASVLWLIAVLAMAHLARIFAPIPWPDYVVDNYAFTPAAYSAEILAEHHYSLPSLLARAIPFVSYIFLHGSYVHLIVNSLFLLAFGPIVARRLKPSLFLLFFLLCGVCAAAAELAVDWGSFVPVVGASGSISGLLGAAMRIFYGRVDADRLAAAPPGVLAPHRAPLAPLFSRAILSFSAVWVIGNIVTGIVGVGVDGEMVAVAWVAHLGGYFAGLAAIEPFDALSSQRSRSAA